mmetsp:Transcript_32602/g.83113  ORF Transcript_32602/g.83113 Transcript_32602/m.83113 type:complete len:204 (+) Transcript_32602:1675-2286(+)
MRGTWRRLASPMVAFTSFMWNLKPNSAMSGSMRRSPPPERRSRSMPNQRSRRARRWSSALGNRMIPPSTEVRCLMACSEKTQMLPCVPSLRPWCSAPIECAQSSITCGMKPNFWKHVCWMRAILSRFAGTPPQCTIMMTLVVGESLASRSSRHMLAVLGSASTHLMRSRLARIGQFVAVQVRGHVSTSSTSGCRPGQLGPSGF